MKRLNRENETITQTEEAEEFITEGVSLMVDYIQ